MDDVFNFIGGVYYIDGEVFDIMYEYDQASCNPNTVRLRGSSYARKDPRINAGRDVSLFSRVSASELNELIARGSYCRVPGFARGRKYSPGQMIGILCIRGRLIEDAINLKVDVRSATLPVGYRNVPGVSTASGKKTDKPRFKAFKKRLDNNHDVAHALCAYEKDVQKNTYVNVSKRARSKIRALDIQISDDPEFRAYTSI